MGTYQKLEQPVVAFTVLPCIGKILSDTKQSVDLKLHAVRLFKSSYGHRPQIVSGSGLEKPLLAGYMRSARVLFTPKDKKHLGLNLGHLVISFSI